MSNMALSIGKAPLIRPVAALAGWTFVMELWMYATRIPAMSKYKGEYQSYVAVSTSADCPQSISAQTRSQPICRPRSHQAFASRQTTTTTCTSSQPCSTRLLSLWPSSETTTHTLCMELGHMLRLGSFTRSCRRLSTRSWSDSRSSRPALCCWLA